MIHQITKYLLLHKYFCLFDRSQVGFFKWANPGLFFVYFGSFQTNITNFYNKYMWKNFHPVYGAGIWTHDHRNMSLLPLPLDQGYRPSFSSYHVKISDEMERPTIIMLIKSK